MDSQMESIDIATIKTAVLRPSAPDSLMAVQQTFQQSIAATSIHKPQLADQHHDGTQSQPTHPLNFPDSDSLPYLPSTVPDSQVIANVEAILQEIPHASVPDVIRELKKMSSQNGSTVPHDTQRMEPEWIEGYLAKRRTMQGTEDPENEAANTHHTLHKGDKGYVELVESHMDELMEVEDELHSEPFEFSPTQASVHGFSQFPESQRFKTPATVGKKRNHNGDFVESPALPRNPLASNRHSTPGKMMGLSQAFAATQAASSPIINGLPLEFRSDRPSPNLNVQIRPVATVESSPMLLRPILPWSSTEPQTKYISVKESPARREVQKIRQFEDSNEDSDDVFSETLEHIKRRQAQKRRDKEAERQLQAVSMTRGGPWSSPARNSSRRARGSSPISTKRGIMTSDPNEELDLPQGDFDSGNASEEETEQEDEVEIAVRRSSQMQRMLVTEEDKENAISGAIQVPETIGLPRVINDFPSEFQASPSIRHAGQTATSYGISQIVEESETFAVADSQPSQTRHQLLQNTNPKILSSGEQTDFVPQSQYPINDPQESSSKEMMGNLFQKSMERESEYMENETSPQNPQRIFQASPALTHLSTNPKSNVAETGEDIQPELASEDEGVQPRRRNLRSQAAPQSTTTERSSARLKDVSDCLIRNTMQPSNKQPTELHDASKSMSDFETAPTHRYACGSYSVPAPLSSKGSPNPLKGKRKRMDEIEGDPSQRSSRTNLDKLKPLLNDSGPGEIFTTSSPIGPGRNRKKRGLYGISPLKPRQARDEETKMSSPHNKGVDGIRVATRDDIPVNPARSLDVSSLLGSTRSSLTRIRQVKHLNIPGQEFTVKTPSTYGKSKSNRSAWDIQASPPQTILPRSTAKLSGLRKQSSTFNPDIVNLPITSPRTCRAATQHHRSEAMIRANAITTSTPPSAEVSHAAPLGDVIAPNQVFACFNGKLRAYYPTKCLGICGSDIVRYQIKWEGYDQPEELDAHGIRSLDLRIGDSVKVLLKNFPRLPYLIRGFKDKVDNLTRNPEDEMTDILGYKTLILAQKQRKSLPADDGPEDLKEAPISAIYLDSNMWGQMKDRTFEYVPPPVSSRMIRPGFGTPIDASSAPSSPTSRSRRIPASTSIPLISASTTDGLFSNMAFAISYDNDFRKSTLTRLITSNGGVILSAGFHELLNDSLVLKHQYSNLGFTALLADKHSRKEKYLQALALGLPCLSGKWIEACISRDGISSWQAYLLPAGESTELEGAIHSRILPKIDPISITLANMLMARPNVFEGASTIFVLGRGKIEERRRPFVFLTQAIGAGRVDKVPDVRAAKALVDQNSSFEWVFVDDRDVDAAKVMFGSSAKKAKHKDVRVKVVGNDFVRQSLVLGRIFEC